MNTIIKDCDSINLDIEKDSEYISQTDNYFYFQNKCKIYEINEYGIINSYDLPERCSSVIKGHKDIYFASRNKLYKLLSDNKFAQKRFRQRILGFLPVNSEYPLVAQICKELKLFQLQLHNNVVNLEKYFERCDASILYFDFVNENLILCIYKTEFIIKYCTMGISGDSIILLRKELLSNDVNVKFSKSILNNYFLLTRKDSYCILRLNESNCSLESVLSNSSSDANVVLNTNYDLVVNGLNGLSEPCLNYGKLDSSLGYNGSELIKLVNNHILCIIKVKDRDVMVEFYDVISNSIFKTIQLSTQSQTNSPPKRVVSMSYSRGLFNIVIELEDSTHTILSFNQEMPTESISYYDPYPELPTTEEIESLIDSSEIIITRNLVDYLISNNIKSCCKKILKCVHVPETEAVKIIKNDLSLVDDFILYTRCSDLELKKAFKNEIDASTFKNILYRLFEMMERYYNNQVDMMDLDENNQIDREAEDRIVIEKIIRMINILLDSKVIEFEEFDKNILQKLQNIVEGCQKEQMDLQSLLSFTNTLLDNKIKVNTNPLITSIEISLD